MIKGKCFRYSISVFRYEKKNEFLTQRNVALNYIFVSSSNFIKKIYKTKNLEINSKECTQEIIFDCNGLTT